MKTREWFLYISLTSKMHINLSDDKHLMIFQKETIKLQKHKGL